VFITSGFTQGNQSTSTPITNTNILWGAAATAILGATLADWQRRREEEEASLSWRTVQGKRAEAAAREEEGGRSGKKKTPGQRAYEKMMKQKHIVGALLAEKKDPVYIPSQRLEDEETNWLNTLNPVYQYEKRKKEAAGGGKPLFAPTKDGVNPPSDGNKAVISITEQELAQLNNLNTAAIVAAYTAWFLALEVANIAIATKIPPFAVPGAIMLGAIGIGIGAYENSVLSSVQSEFDEAVRNGTDVQIWKDNKQALIVYSGVGETVTVVNSPIAIQYVNYIVQQETGARIL
jgi:hypothetical protein